VRIHFLLIVQMIVSRSDGLFQDRSYSLPTPVHPMWGQMQGHMGMHPPNMPMSGMHSPGMHMSGMQHPNMPMTGMQPTNMPMSGMPPPPPQYMSYYPGMHPGMPYGMPFPMSSYYAGPPMNQVQDGQQVSA
jgi:hypothetical protein